MGEKGVEGMSQPVQKLQGSPDPEGEGGSGGHQTAIAGSECEQGQSLGMNGGGGRRLGMRWGGPGDEQGQTDGSEQTAESTLPNFASVTCWEGCDPSRGRRAQLLTPLPGPPSGDPPSQPWACSGFAFAHVTRQGHLLSSRNFSRWRHRLDDLVEMKEHLRFAPQVKWKPQSRKMCVRKLSTPLNGEINSSALPCQQLQPHKLETPHSVHLTASQSPPPRPFLGLIIKHGTEIICIDLSNFPLSSSVSILDVIMLMC